MSMILIHLGQQRDFEWNSTYMALPPFYFAIEPEMKLTPRILWWRSLPASLQLFDFNISAMSFGSLSAMPIQALNNVPKKENFFHNTGEGRESPLTLVRAVILVGK